MNGGCLIRGVVEDMCKAKQPDSTGWIAFFLFPFLICWCSVLRMIPFGSVYASSYRQMLRLDLMGFDLVGTIATSKQIRDTSYILPFQNINDF